jgi:predicted Rossmann fold flavoprotein
MDIDVDVAIVGAGAAGLATAVFTRERDPARVVLLVDGAHRPGAKILVSGGGRCNVTNRSVSDRDFWGGASSIVRRVLKGFSVEETIAYFAGIGVSLHEEEHGKLFPDSNRARTVLDALLVDVRQRGVACLFGHRVERIAGSGGDFTLTTTNGAVRARHVVLATGGQSLPKSGSDGAGYALARALGHTIVPPQPALVPLLFDQAAMPDYAPLSGISQPAELTVWVDDRVSVRLSGSLLWTHFGVSGPVALNASRHWTRAIGEGRAARITVNLLPPARFDDVDERLRAAAIDRPRAALSTILSSWLAASLATCALAHAAIDRTVTAAHLSRDDRRRLARTLVEWPLPIAGTRGYNYAEVTAGGVDLKEIDAATMESRICPGLYLIGEILDVDGRIGGFNFQWAWSSARVAAAALARKAGTSWPDR